MKSDIPQQHLDDKVLADLQSLLAAEFDDLITTFLDDAERRHRAMQARLQSGAAAAEELRRDAHSFKGSCLNLGAVRLAALCLSLEEDARRGRLQGAQALVTEIGSELAYLDRLLRERYL